MFSIPNGEAGTFAYFEFVLSLLPSYNLRQLVHPYLPSGKRDSLWKAGYVVIH